VRVTGEVFRRWYESRNLTQGQVAGLLGIGQNRVSNMATGKVPVSRQTARMLALAEIALRHRLAVSVPVLSAAIDLGERE
jgi:predicted XRE-type DNA-binding protein